MRGVAWFLLILLTSACASNRGEWKPPPAPNEPLRGGVVEFQVTSYDGENISGRVLIGATIDPLVIDGRLIVPGHVGIYPESLHACGTKDPVPYLPNDIVTRPPRQDEIITIRPGYWYGGTVKFWLFDKRWTRLGPDCLEVDVAVRALDEREIAKIPLHVVRTDKPPAPPDGGAPAEPKPPASDAGAP